MLISKLIAHGFDIYADELDNDISYTFKFYEDIDNTRYVIKFDKSELLSCFNANTDFYLKVERWIISIEREKKLNKILTKDNFLNI